VAVGSAASIINSITPITTLTTAIKRRLSKGDMRKSVHEITGGQIEDALKSVEVIEERAQGLIEFVERFKSLTDVPGLKIVSVPVKKIIDHVAILFSKELSAGNTELKTDITPGNLTLHADEKLIEQVLINLVKNALRQSRKPVALSISGLSESSAMP
jgi:nitrogen fixation/metabolism regulation signal transduction histidine kinase